jgi:uncharacterized membrane protein YheB (UPF0754 family)
MILTPLVGAFIGWVTNLIAVRMLFRPLRPLRVLGLTLQGLIPRRRTEIAATVARTVERDLLSPGEISAVLHRLDWEGEVSRAVDEIVERRAGALRTLPFADTLLEPLKEALTRNLLKEVEERRGGLVERFRERLDLQEMVVRRLDQYDLAAFEALVLKVAERELSAIVWLGALLGFLVGLAQVGLLALLG